MTPEDHYRRYLLRLSEYQIAQRQEMDSGCVGRAITPGEGFIWVARRHYAVTEFLYSLMKDPAFHAAGRKQSH